MAIYFLSKPRRVSGSELQGNPLLHVQFTLPLNINSVLAFKTLYLRVLSAWNEAPVQTDGGPRKRRLADGKNENALRLDPVHTVERGNELRPREIGIRGAP